MPALFVHPLHETRNYGPFSILRKKNRWSIIRSFLSSKFSLYVMTLLGLVLLSSHLTRFIVAPAADIIEQRIGFGTGTGISSKYALFVGPGFTIPYCLAVIPIGNLAEKYNKVYMLSTSAVVWCVCSGLLAIATQYWHLIVLRVGLAIGQAACATLGATILSDYFPPLSRGLAFSLWGLGPNIAQGIVFGLGNVLIDERGYQLTLVYISAPGIIVGILLALTVKNRDPDDPDMLHPEPKDSETSLLKLKTNSTASDDNVPRSRCGVFLWVMKNPMLVALFAGACFRQTSGNVWNYFKNQYFQNLFNLTKTEIAIFMSWVPIVGGCLGCIFWGYVADWWSGKEGRGVLGRLQVELFTQFIDVFFIFGILYTPVPWPFYLLIFDEFLRAYAIGNCIAIISIVAPKSMRAQVLSIFFFFYQGTSGNAVVLLPAISNLFEMKLAVSDDTALFYSLMTMYFGFGVICTIFFCFAIYFQARDPEQIAARIVAGKHSIDLDRLYYLRKGQKSSANKTVISSKGYNTTSSEKTHREKMSNEVANKDLPPTFVGGDI